MKDENVIFENDNIQKDINMLRDKINELEHYARTIYEIIQSDINMLKDKINTISGAGFLIGTNTNNMK